MDGSEVNWVKWAHVVGATVLLGTGLGTAENGRAIIPH